MCEKEAWTHASVFFLEVPVIALWTNLQSLMGSQLLENLPGTLWLVAS